jgi:ribosomal protein S18 acetylase RimI-like enzyme
VLQAFQERKIGQWLLDLAIAIAQERNADQVWLGVWERNPKAIASYRKNGFREFGKHLFQLGSDGQTDILMKLHLKR